MQFRKIAVQETDPEVGHWQLKFNKKTGILVCTSESSSPDFEAIRGTITEVIGHIYQTSGIEIKIIDVQLSNVPIDKVLDEQSKLSKELNLQVKQSPILKKKTEELVEDDDDSSTGGVQRQKETKVDVKTI